jgi:hypothetical protein
MIGGPAQHWQQRRASNKALMARTGPQNQQRRLATAVRHGEAAVRLVPLLLRCTSNQSRTALFGLRLGGQSAARFADLRNAHY